MKILFIQDSLGTGGAERSNLELWYYLRDQGVHLKIVVLKHRREGVEEEVLQAGFNVQFLRKGNYITHVLQIKEAVEHFSPDIVHSVLFKSNLRTRGAKLLTPFTHIESLVNCPYNEFRENDKNVNRTNLLVYKKIDKITQKFGVDHFHANGLTVSRHYQENLGVPGEKITVINRGRKHIAFSSAEVTGLKKRLYPDQDKVIFINVARHEFQKAQDKIIEAMAGSALLKSRCLFVSVGREGELTKIINEKVRGLGLEDQVIFLGHRRDVPLLLLTADVFVFPSRFEGLPGALIEAESAGLPVVCSDIGNNLEVVIKDDNALTFPVDNVEKLQEGMERLVREPELRREMGIRSKEIFEERFLLENINKRMFRFYREVLSTAHGPTGNYMIE